MLERLPQGLDPVRAGRLGLWLLGLRSHSEILRARVPTGRAQNARQPGPSSGQRGRQPQYPRGAARDSAGH